MLPVVGEVVQRAVELVAPVHCSIVELQGEARYTSTPLTAWYLGTGLNLGFLERFFFAAPNRRTLARCSSPFGLRIGAAVRSGDTDVVLLDLPPAWRPLMPRDGLLVPAWLSQVVDLETPEATLPRRLEREVHRHLRRRGYRVEFSGEERDFLRFHRELYEPYLRTRFGAEAVIVPEARMLARLRGQVLAKLYQGDRWLLGLALARHGSVLRFGWFGATQNPPPAGASETLDWTCIRDARDSGLKQVIMGSSRPCLTDGVVRYKQRFGARFAATRLPPAQIALASRSWPPAVLECLRRQPLVRLQGGEVRAYRVMPSGYGSPFVLQPLEP